MVEDSLLDLGLALALEDDEAGCLVSISESPEVEEDVLPRLDLFARAWSSSLLLLLLLLLLCSLDSDEESSPSLSCRRRARFLCPPSITARLLAPASRPFLVGVFLPRCARTGTGDAAAALRGISWEEKLALACPAPAHSPHHSRTPRAALTRRASTARHANE